MRQGTRDGWRTPLRYFGAHRHPSALTSRPFERRPSIAVLCSAHDRRADWLRAGQALEHVLLVATARGLRASLLHQALEWPDLREQLVPPAGDRRAHARWCSVSATARKDLLHRAGRWGRCWTRVCCLCPAESGPILPPGPEPGGGRRGGPAGGIRCGGSRWASRPAR